jgi:hypothetical protein
VEPPPWLLRRREHTASHLTQPHHVVGIGDHGRDDLSEVRMRDADDHHLAHRRLLQDVLDVGLEDRRAARGDASGATVHGHTTVVLDDSAVTDARPALDVAPERVLWLGVPRAHIGRTHPQLTLTRHHLHAGERS